MKALTLFTVCKFMAVGRGARGDSRPSALHATAVAAAPGARRYAPHLGVTLEVISTQPRLFRAVGLLRDGEAAQLEGEDDDGDWEVPCMRELRRRLKLTKEKEKAA